MPLTMHSSSETARAVLTDGTGGFTLAEIHVGQPEAGEVLVRVMAAGVCHTDLDSLSWRHRMTEPAMVVGHEGAGMVEAVGPGVRGLVPGDRVLLNWAIPCGVCFQCLRGAETLCEARPSVPAVRRVRAGVAIEASFGLGSMATHAVVPHQAVVAIPDQVPFPIAAVMGCGVMTGFGSVVNAAGVEPGASVAVLGTGGVGLSAILGAVYAGAERIIAVDVSPSRLAMAESFGATHLILADRDDAGLLRAAREVRNLTGRGADYAFECTAVPSLGASPLAMVRNGGTAIAVSGIEQVVPIDMELFEWDKRYLNPLYGQCRPARDFPLLCSLYVEGRLPLDTLISKTYPLEGLDEAFVDMRQGRIAKGVLLPHG